MRDEISVRTSAVTWSLLEPDATVISAVA